MPLYFPFIPLFILATLVECVRTPIPRRKWLWVLFILLGFGSIQLNWTTADYAIQAFHVNLLGAGAVASGRYAPWVLSFGIPLGAITFWSRRKEFLTKHEVSKSLELDR